MAALPSFTFLIKRELVHKRMSKNEVEAFIDGMLYANYLDLTTPITISLRNHHLFQAAIKLLKQSKRSWHVVANRLVFALSTPPRFIRSATASAFLAGAFLVSGSTSRLNSSSYHLQLRLKNQTHLHALVAFAAKHIHFNVAVNKNQFIMYIKRHELIGDFLYILGAQSCYFQFLEAVIARDHRNQITRISNLDIHNQTKLVEAHQVFLDQLALVEAHGLHKLFTRDQLLFFHFKRQHPYLPLSQIADELARRYQLVKTKAGLNHWLIKLRTVCQPYAKTR